MKRFINCRLFFSEKDFTFWIRNAEIVLHPHWGDAEFWRARRSMRFSKQLVQVANLYRLRQFGSNDSTDSIQRPSDWRDEKVKLIIFLCNYIFY